MKTTNTALLALTFSSLFSASQMAMASHEDAAGYGILFGNDSRLPVTPHDEASTLNGNLENSATYGALYSSIAKPQGRTAMEHAVHQHKDNKIGLASLDERTSREVVGDTFYFDSSR